MSKFLVSTVETYRVDSDEEAKTLIEEANHSSMFVFDLIGKPGEQNLSVVSSVEQCLTDEDLQNQMKHSPFYTVYVKSNKY